MCPSRGWSICVFQDSTENCRRRQQRRVRQHDILQPAVQSSPIHTSNNVEATLSNDDEWMNEWKCEDFKCVWKPTESRLCLTHYVNKSSRWYKSNDSLDKGECRFDKLDCWFDKVKRNFGLSTWTCSICFDFVERTKNHEKLVLNCCQNGNNVKATFDFSKKQHMHFPPSVLSHKRLPSNNVLLLYTESVHLWLSLRVPNFNDRSVSTYRPIGNDR